jgi:hypothetical protein
MNTPDQGPKDGDFVAYLEELERHQLRRHGPASGTPGPAAGNNTIQRAGAVSPASVFGTVGAIPVGLVAIGLAFVIAGVVFNGGFILVVIGILLLAQAVRTTFKAAAVIAKERLAQPAQQMTALLTAHARGKSPPVK